MAGRWSPTDPPPIVTNRNRGEDPSVSIQPLRTTKLSARSDSNFIGWELRSFPTYVSNTAGRSANSWDSVPAKKKRAEYRGGERTKTKGGQEVVSAGTVPLQSPRECEQCYIEYLFSFVLFAASRTVVRERSDKIIFLSRRDLDFQQTIFFFKGVTCIKSIYIYIYRMNTNDSLTWTDLTYR